MRNTALMTAALFAMLTLAACNNPANDGIRNGPQAVNPSPSLLAQRENAGVAPGGSPLFVCDTPDTAPCYAASSAGVLRHANHGATRYAADGSRPIID